MLNEAVTTELRRELIRLEAMRKLLDRQIGAINQLLTSEPVESGNPILEQSNDSFIGQVRSALKEVNRQATAADVTELLESKGVTQRGKYPLHTEVSVELGRLASRPNSGVERVRRGLYRINYNKRN